MKKHLLALLSVGSLVTLLPGCGSCCQQGKEVTTVEESTSSSEVAAVEAVVEAEAPAQDTASEAAPVAEDKH